MIKPASIISPNTSPKVIINIHNHYTIKYGIITLIGVA